MSNLQSLGVLLDQAERQRDAAIAEHQRAQNASAAAAEQSNQLIAYRRDYEQRWTGQFRSAGPIELVHCYHSFTQRLAQAIEQQARIAEHALSQVERALAALRETEMRCASVRKLVERRVLEQRLAAERRDQKQTDEAASRAAWNRQGATRPSPLM